MGLPFRLYPDSNSPPPLFSSSIWNTSCSVSLAICSKFRVDISGIEKLVFSTGEYFQEFICCVMCRVKEWNGIGKECELSQQRLTVVE